MIFKFNRLLSKKEKNMILNAYQSGFEDGYRVGSDEIADFVIRYCEERTKGEPIAEKMKIEKNSDGIRIYGEMTEGGKRFLKEIEDKK